MKIAVIGGGIAGLVSAWSLGKHHHVTLLERHSEPGMGAHGVDLGDDLGPGRVDVPVRTFHEGYYPHLTRLYQELGVATEPIDFATTYSTLQGSTYFRYHNLRLGSLSLPLVRRPWRKTVRRILWDLWRLHRYATSDRAEASADPSIGEFLHREGYSKEFCDLFLLPLFAVICTCSYDNVRSFPASTMLEYLRSGIFARAVRRPIHGTSDVVARLIEPVASVRCGVRVAALERSRGGVTVRLEGAGSEDFDHAVIATQANHVASFLDQLTPAEESMLSCFRYDTVRVVTHTDTALLPADRTTWAPINAAVSEQHDRPMATIWIAAAQPSLGLSRAVFQTVHPLIEPRPECVLGSTDFARPVVDGQTADGYLRLEQLHAESARRVWFCGSYASQGIPLLESATASAFRVTDRLQALQS